MTLESAISLRYFGAFAVRAEDDSGQLRHPPGPRIGHGIEAVYVPADDFTDPAVTAISSQLWRSAAVEGQPSEDQQSRVDVKLQLKQAGVRLAAVLNKALGKQVAGEQ